MTVTPLLHDHADMAHQAMPRVVAFFEHLQPQDLRTLGTLYAADAHFKDPFNDVRGLEAIAAIFEHMFETLDRPHFVVNDRVAHGRQAFLSWEFRFRFRGHAQWQHIHGATRLQFDDRGLVMVHRDYWDAAEELYEKLPLVGSLMRWLKRRMTARG